jgi:hypothetical protein
VQISHYLARMKQPRTPKAIIESLGVPEVARTLGVSEARIKRARFSRELPAAWLDGLEKLAGRPLDRAVFSFKRGDA